MPQYYSGADPALAFSSGLLAGFQVVDQMKARKRQHDLEERRLQLAEDNQEFNQDIALRAEGRAERAEGRIEETHERNKTLWGREDADYEHGLKRRPVVEAQADAQAAANLDATRTNTSATKEALAERRNKRGVAQQYATDFLTPAEEPPAAPTVGGGRPSLQQVGAAAVQQAGAPPAAGGPVDLRQAQREADTAPGFFQRLANDVAEHRDAKRKEGKADSWERFADPSKDVTGRVKEARRDPLRLVEPYLRDRSIVSPKARETIDLTMRNAIADRTNQVREQLAALDPADPKNTPKIRALEAEKAKLGEHENALAKAAVASAPQIVGITNSVKPSDPKVISAVQTAATALNGVTPTMSPGEMRALNTQLGRIGNSKRLTPKQVETLSKAYAYGVIDEQTLNNWRLYGGPLAPAQPKITSIGAGGSFIQYPNGQIAFIEPLGGDKAAGTKVRQGVNDAAQLVESLIAKGDVDLPEKSGLAAVSEALTLVQANAAQFQQATGIPVIDASGNFDPSELLKPQNVRVLIDYRQKTAAGNVDPKETELPIEGAENSVETIPAAGVAQPGTIVMGYRFLGGDPKDARNYEPE